MKKFITLVVVIAFLIPGIVLADAKCIHKTKTWCFIQFIDDFTDEIDYGLITSNFGKYGKPGIAFSIFEEKFGGEKLHGSLCVSGSIRGIGITYRVDKNPAVTFGHKYTSQTGSSLYILSTKECKQLIADFKKGISVVYVIHSGNQFVDDEKERISLTGFTEICELFEKNLNK